MRGIASPARLVALALAGLLALLGWWYPAAAAGAATHRHADAMGGRLTKVAGHIGQGRPVEDLDGDGLTNWTELNRTGTYPRKADTDGDGLGDGTEVNRTKTNPHRADTDGDGLGDGVEVKRTRTDPLTADTDGDGLGDGIEMNSTKTNPRKADTDGDGYSDRDEVIAGSDPRNRSSIPAKPPPVILPKAVWTPPSAALVGVPVTLDGSASTGSGPLACTWSFENADGSIVWQTRDGCLIEFTFESTGTKYVRLTVTGPAGGTSASEHSFGVGSAPDTTPPETSIDASPSSPTQATAASFSFSSSEAGSSFQCKLDSAAWTGCSSPQSYSGLSVADHTFSVRATDPAGNVDDTRPSIPGRSRRHRHRHRLPRPTRPRRRPQSTPPPARRPRRPPPASPSAPARPARASSASWTRLPGRGAARHSPIQGSRSPITPSRCGPPTRPAMWTTRRRSVPGRSRRHRHRHRLPRPTRPRRRPQSTPPQLADPGDRRQLLLQLQRGRLELPVQAGLGCLDGVQLATVLFRALGRRSHLRGAGHRRGRQCRRHAGHRNLDGRGDTATATATAELLFGRCGQRDHLRRRDGAFRFRQERLRHRRCRRRQLQRTIGQPQRGRDLHQRRARWVAWTSTRPPA